MNQLRLICARLAGNELVAAECRNLTGGIPDAEGVAICHDLSCVPRSAYLTTGLRCLAEAPDLDGLAAQVAALPPGAVDADQFRIEFLRLAPLREPGKQRAIRAIADALPAYPNLDQPRYRFMVVVQLEKLWFGEILVEGQHTYRPHDSKPYRTSSSLPSRLARAVVNLVSPPARSILDPFCGTGSILLEAQALGLTAFGSDRNPRMVAMSRSNLRHFKYQAQVTLGEARGCLQTADALVTDLPYGRLLQAERVDLLGNLTHLAALAPLAVYLAEEDITPMLKQAGYQRVEVWRVRKHASLSRYVHRAMT